MAADRLDLALRIVIVDPVPGVALAPPRGTSGAEEHIAPSTASVESVTVDFRVIVAPSPPGPPSRLLGSLVQGPPTGRFVYGSIGRDAGDAASPWARRAKIPLTGLTWPLTDSVQAGGRVEARVSGRGRDARPNCASPSLLPPGWQAA